MQGRQYFGAIIMSLGVYCTFLHGVVSHIFEQVVRYWKTYKCHSDRLQKFSLLLSIFFVFYFHTGTV